MWPNSQSMRGMQSIIKFDELLNRADALGAHYVQLAITAK